MSDGDSSTRRKPIPKRLRFEIMRRDNHACRYCGAAAPDTKLTIDHVIPVALGGTDDPANLVTACVECNGGKTSTAPDQAVVTDVSEVQMRWSRALAQAAQMRREELAPSPMIAQFDAAWNRWHRVSDDKPWERPAQWPDSVDVWVKAGLNMDDFNHYIGVAMRNEQTRDKWRYFCGCCWKEARRREELANQLMLKAVPWHTTDDGKTLYTDPLCGGCQGDGYVRVNNPNIYEECWCVSEYPYTSEVR